MPIKSKPADGLQDNKEGKVKEIAIFLCLAMQA